MEHGHFSWFQFVPGLSALPYHVAAAGTVAALLMVCGLVARLSLASHKDYTVPSPKLNFLGFFDLLAEGCYKMAQMALGKDAATFYPLIGSIFVFILFCNLLGLLPGFTPPTDNVNTTLAMGLFVFVYYNYQGFKASGVAYLKHFMGPVWYLAWLLLPIEIVSHVVRPFTLALRLKGNMLGDHTVIATFTDMVPYGVPAIFYFLGLLVCVLQAFIFSMLTMVYIAMAKETDHH